MPCDGSSDRTVQTVRKAGFQCDERPGSQIEMFSARSKFKPGRSSDGLCVLHLEVHPSEGRREPSAETVLSSFLRKDNFISFG
ncbi:MAG: hypothetical protein APR56_11400 [Methanosaeta sp. SDB]|nr:MAG: hypothetical protein APR56_11400 [Methanosaeta sp. SDB]